MVKKAAPGMRSSLTAPHSWFGQTALPAMPMRGASDLALLPARLRSWSGMLQTKTSLALHKDCSPSRGRGRSWCIQITRALSNGAGASL